jgi:hypothetical protein
MATFAEIIDQIELGWAYYTQQLEEIRTKMVEGCFACTTSELNCLAAAIISLEYDVETENNTDLTTRTYDLLMSLLSSFTGSFTSDPTVVIEGVTIISVPGSFAQTAVVYPDEGEVSYTFPELIGQNVLSVYRGSGTVLRAHSGGPDNEFAKFDNATGQITLNYGFSPGESLWVAYQTI